MIGKTPKFAYQCDRCKEVYDDKETFTSNVIRTPHGRMHLPLGDKYCEKCTNYFRENV